MPLAERIALEKRINEDQEMEKTDPNYLMRKLDPQYTPEVRAIKSNLTPTATVYIYFCLHV